MKIKKITSQYRRDFSAVMECESCGSEAHINTGYDDRFYHDNVIPNMECPTCHESTKSLGGEVTQRDTKYPDNLQL